MAITKNILTDSTGFAYEGGSKTAQNPITDSTNFTAYVRAADLNDIATGINIIIDEINTHVSQTELEDTLTGYIKQRFNFN